jgi:hypothetical protein
MMRVEKATPGMRVVDSWPYSKAGSAVSARYWADHGVHAFAGYLGLMNATRLNYVLDVGLAFFPVTLAGAYENGAADEVAQLKALGIPPGATVFLDLEGKRAFNTPIPTLFTYCKDWCAPIVGEGYEAGIYLGVPQPFTELEMYDLPFTKYWKGMGSVRDRFDKLAEPWRDQQHHRGWNLEQVPDTQSFGGFDVDFSMVAKDYKGDVISWVRR